MAFNISNTHTVSLLVKRFAHILQTWFQSKIPF